jgi:hypothetical protein
MYARFGVTDIPESDITPCKFFQNKEDVISVVRCKNCVYRIKEVVRKVDNLVYWPCRKHGIEVLLTDYCSSGNNTVIGKDLER